MNYIEHGLDTQIDSLELSNRTRNTVLRQFPPAQKVTLKDIAGLTEAGLYRTNGCGRHTITELKDLLKANSLVLGMTNDELIELEDARCVRSNTEAHTNPALLTPFWNIDPSVRTENVIVRFFDCPSSQSRFANRSGLLSDIALRSSKNIYLGDIACFTASEYLSLQNFGRKSLDEIETALSERGLALGMHFEDWARIASDPEVGVMQTPLTNKPKLNSSLFLKFDHFDTSVRTRNGIKSFIKNLGNENAAPYRRNICAMLQARAPEQRVLLGDLVQFSRSEFLQTQNFGKNSLNELIEILKKNDLWLGMEMPEWNNEVIFSFFEEKGELLNETISASEQSKYDALLPEGQITLEDEIEALLNFVNLGIQRNYTIFKMRFGLDGKGGQTLEEIGTVFGVTRERIRQITQKSSRKFKRDLMLNLPVLESILKYLGQSRMKSLDDLQNEIYDKGWTRTLFDIRGILELNDFVNIGNSSFDNYEIDRLPKTDQWYFFEGEIRNKIKQVRSLIGRISSSHGFFKFADLDDHELGQSMSQNDLSLIKASITEIDDIQCLNETTGAFFVTGKRNRLENAILKCLYTNRPLKPGRVKDGLRRYPRLKRIPSTTDLLKFCELHPDFSVTDGWIDTILALDPEDTYSETEAFFISCFEDPEAILTFDEMKALCLREGMNPVTFYLLSKRTPVLESDGYRNYALRGNPRDPFKLDIASSGYKATALPEKLSSLKSGVTEDGYNWFSFELDHSIIETGAIVPPDDISEQLQDRISIMDSEEHLFGKTQLLENGLSGFKSVFEDKGGEVGDLAILILNKTHNVFWVEIGSNDLIEQAKESGFFEQADDEELVEL